MKILNRNTNKIVAVAMSGGLDSSMSARLLQKKGYQVFGIFMDLGHGDKNSQEAARRVCQKLGIDFKVLEIKDEFTREVISYFLSSYQAGITPNPCVRCNKFIKFGRLLEEAQNWGADYLATGHYIRKKKLGTKFKIYRSEDKAKDQSYFLYNLKQKDLKKIIFPLAKIHKVKLRKLALEIGLPFISSESQDICFLDGDHNNFLKEHLDLIPGKIKLLTGEEVGEHQGLPLYTIGQRRGIEIGGIGPFYVAKLDYETNTLYVVKDWNDPVMYGDKLIARDLNWISGRIPSFPYKCQAVIRYGHAAVPVWVNRQNDGEYLVRFVKPQRAITPGQSIVFYRKNELLGGGIIA